MRLLRLLVLLPVVSTLTYAQRGGMRGGGGFRGGFVSPGFRSNIGFGKRPFFFPRHRAFFPGSRSFFGAGFGSPFFSYGYPLYTYFDGYPYLAAQYDYGYSPSPQVVIYPTASGPLVPVPDPPLTVRPEIREYPDALSSAYEKPVYLIAFKNPDLIRAAQAYWVTGSTLHYITLGNEQKLAPLDSVDRALTYRLNRERHTDIRLPPAP